MPIEAAMTPAPAGNDSVRPSLTLDDASELDIHDPSEDTNDIEQTPQSESEPDEADVGQESDEIEANATEDEDDATGDEVPGEDDTSTPEPGDDVAISVGGEKLTLGELKKSYFREADYTRQKQAVSQKERELGALATSVTNSVNAIADYLTKMLPPAPDPNLAVTDAAAYVRQQALHQQAMANISEVLKAAQAPKTATNQLTQQQHMDLLQAETAKLAEAFPQVATADGHKKFFDAAAATARELGYSDAEIGSATDHRLFKLAHYARLGLQAEAARAKAKLKVVNVPPVAPNKRPAAQDATKRQANRKAVDRLKRSGSLDDAINIDWD